MSEAEFIAELIAYLAEHSSDDFKNDRETTIKLNDLAELLEIIDRQSRRITELEKR